MSILRIFVAIILTALIVKLSFAEKVFFFEGQIDPSNNEFKMTINLDNKSSLAAVIHKLSDNKYHLQLNADHIQTPFFDFLSKIEGSIEVIQDKNAPELSISERTFRGSIWSQYSLVDFKPVEELSGNFEIKNQRLYLTKLSFGNIHCNGYIDLMKPYKLDLAFNIVEVGMNDFLNFWSANKEFDSSGTVIGKIKASGTIDQLVLKGNLKSSYGFVEKFDYDSISLHIEGVYPNMKIDRSTVSKSDGVSFKLDGPFNLSDRDNFKKQIKSLTMAPLVSDSASEMEWTIKRLNLEESGVTEIKYRHKKGDALSAGTLSEDEADMIGFERTRKF